MQIPWLSTAGPALPLQRAFEQCSDGILMTDAKLDDGGPFIIFANAAYERMCGYGRSELIGRSPRKMQGPETDRALLDDLGAALRAGRAFSGETVNYRKDGRPYCVEWTITPVQDEKGEIAAFLSIQRETTSRRQAEDALDEALAALTRSNERLRRMARVLAHDLQDPLSAVRGYLELTQQVEGTRLMAGRNYIRSALAGVEAISTKIKELLQSAERVSQVANPVDLRQPIALALDDVADLKQRVGAEISVIGRGEVTADAAELREILQNLLSNALKYRHPDRRPAIRIRISPLRAHVVQVSVEDNGRGIPANLTEDIFAEGYRTVDGGSGIGLSYVRCAVEGLGGTVAVRSQEGLGSTFMLTLPAPATAAATH